MPLIFYHISEKSPGWNLIKSQFSGKAERACGLWVQQIKTVSKFGIQLVNKNSKIHNLDINKRLQNFDTIFFHSFWTVVSFLDSSRQELGEQKVCKFVDELKDWNKYPVSYKLNSILDQSNFKPILD